MSVIILLTHRHQLGAEMLVVSQKSGFPGKARDRADAMRFTPDEARDFIERNEDPQCEGPFRDYRMFIDPA